MGHFLKLEGSRISLGSILKASSKSASGILPLRVFVSVALNLPVEMSRQAKPAQALCNGDREHKVVGCFVKHLFIENHSRGDYPYNFPFDKAFG